MMGLLDIFGDSGNRGLLGAAILANNTRPLGQTIGNAFVDYSQAQAKAKEYERQKQLQDLQMQKIQHDMNTPNLPKGMRIGANGQPEWIPEYLKGRAKISAAGAPIVNNSINPFAGNQQKKESEEIGKLFANKYMDIINSGTAAYTSNAELDRLNELLGMTYTGTGGDAYQAALKAGRMFGIDLEGVGEGEAAQALSNQMALKLRSPEGGAGMPGALSDKDREFLVSMVPGLTTTPEGRQLMVETRQKLNQRNIEVMDMAMKYRAKHGRIDEQFFMELKAYADANPLFEPVQASGDGWGIRRK